MNTIEQIVEFSREIRTFTGTYIDVFEPKLELINIEDIAHSLSRQCRFGGHVINYYSVAEHSIWVAQRVPKDQKLAALLHDASEAYLVDIPKPIKRHFPQYNDMEDQMMKAISLKFGFQYPFHSSIKEADKAALQWEWDNKVLVDLDPQSNLSPQAAKLKFLDFFYQISNRNFVENGFNVAGL